MDSRDQQTDAATGQTPAAWPRRPLGFVDPSPEASELGGTASHQGPSYNDPLVGPENLGGTPRGRPSASEPGAPPASATVWMTQPVDQGGFGAHVDSDAQNPGAGDVDAHAPRSERSEDDA